VPYAVGIMIIPSMHRPSLYFHHYHSHGWIFAVVVFILGLIFLVKPEWHIRFLVWSQEAFLGAKFVPSDKTKTIIQYYGVLFVAVALVIVWLTIARGLCR